jgi:hypothetical protein
MSSDAIVVLKADHKEIRNLFRKFRAAGDKAAKEKAKIVGQFASRPIRMPGSQCVGADLFCSGEHG